MPGFKELMAFVAVVAVVELAIAPPEAGARSSLTSPRARIKTAAIAPSIMQRFRRKGGVSHMLDHFPLTRDEFQRLGHVLADLAQSVVATAWAGRRRWIDDALARQMRGQRTARGLAPLERRRYPNRGHSPWRIAPFGEVLAGSTPASIRRLQSNVVTQFPHSSVF